jgi:hypothetical protein
MKVGELAMYIRDFVLSATDAFVARFCPNDRLPRFVGGYASYNRTDSALVRLYGMLARLGMQKAAGRPLEERIRNHLTTVEGRGYETWWSLFIAEAVEAFGSDWDSNPVVQGLTAEQQREVAEATDSNHLVLVDERRLEGKPNNYWVVIARLEQVRQRLGLQKDDTIFRLALEQTEQVLCHGRGDYMDDDADGAGRYDVYTFHALDTSAPLWPHLPSTRLAGIIDAHERLVLAAMRPDGGIVGWGRSVEIGPNWAADTVSTLLAAGYGRDKARLLGFVHRAAQRFMDIEWQDDAIAVHREGTSHWYRGTQRLLEFSLDALGTMAHMAIELQRLADANPALDVETDDAKLYPDQDTWIQFDDRGLGAWCYRRGAIDFQLPLVDGYVSDYVAAPLAYGWLEQPVDSAMACGVPNLLIGKKRYLPLRAPENIAWRDGALSWETTRFTHYDVKFDWWRPSKDLAGRRRVTLRVDGDTIVGEEHWTFDEAPDALGIWFAEAGRALHVEWGCDAPHHATTVGVSGMQDWRSYWHGLRYVHQLDIEPVKEVRVSYRLRMSD